MMFRTSRERWDRFPHFLEGSFFVSTFPTEPHSKMNSQLRASKMLTSLVARSARGCLVKQMVGGASSWTEKNNFLSGCF